MNTISFVSSDVVCIFWTSNEKLWFFILLSNTYVTGQKAVRNLKIEKNKKPVYFTKCTHFLTVSSN